MEPFTPGAQLAAAQREAQWSQGPMCAPASSAHGFQCTRWRRELIAVSCLGQAAGNCNIALIFLKD